MSGPVARLIPLISNNELSGSENGNNGNNSSSLQQQQQQQQQQNRPTLVLHDNQSLQLGRNKTTNITDTEISRHLATVSCENGQVFLRVIKKEKPRRQPQHHAVHIQNRLVKTYSNVPLQNNDVIALRGNDYCYTLLYCTPNETLSSSSSSSSQQQSQSSTCNNNNNKSLFPPVNLLEDTSCPICMDLLVQATALHPCGHLFCKQCCRHLQRRGGNKKPECPTCRQPVRGQTPLKTLDELVWKLVLSGHFDTDEVQSYLERSNRTLTDAERQQLFGGSNTMVGSNTTVGSNEAPPPRKRRRHRQQQPASFVYNGTNGGTSAADAICLD